MGWIEFILVLVVLTNLKLLASSRLGASIRVVARQGLILGALPLLAHQDALSLQHVALAAGSGVIKGGVFPWLLFRAVREAELTREVEPYVGYLTSLLAGVGALGAAFWMGTRLPVPVAMFSILSGLFLIISRKRALNQVLGFLVLENGVFTFGAGVLVETPQLVEVGVLLDVFVGVFVMGIIIFHINREFDHIDTDQLSALKD